MNYFTIILYSQPEVCGRNICRKSVEEVFITENGRETYHLMAIAFNTEDVTYIPRLLFLLQAALYGGNYSRDKHECLAWSVICYATLLKSATLPEAPNFFLDVIAERTNFHLDARQCFCFMGLQAEYDKFYDSLRDVFVYPS